MKLSSIRLNSFRNHKYSCLSFADNVNVIYGNNGQGKTNILDGIAYLCLTKGFISNIDSNAVLIDENEFGLEGIFCSDNNISSKTKINYSINGKGKNIFQNEGKVDKAISYIGQYPIVILAPQNYGIVSGLPAERRKFIDMVISQSSKSYLFDVIEYKKVLKQRNKILMDFKITKKIDSELFESWSHSLVKYGSKIILKREIFIKEFIPYFMESYKKITSANEVPNINYFPSFGKKNEVPENISDLFYSNLKSISKDEMRRGSSLLGPHKDEISFEINNMDVREFASQGQQKTFLIALKIAEFYFLKEKCSETPIMVLDDVFSELDKSRSKFLLNFLQNTGQVFISSTSSEVFDESLSYDVNKKYFVESGRVN